MKYGDHPLLLPPSVPSPDTLFQFSLKNSLYSILSPLDSDRALLPVLRMECGPKSDQLAPGILLTTVLVLGWI